MNILLDPCDLHYRRIYRLSCPVSCWYLYVLISCLMKVPISPHVLYNDDTYTSGLLVGWDGTKKIVPWDKYFFSYPMRWDFFKKVLVPPHGISSKKVFVPWDGTIFKNLLSHPIPSHGITYYSTIDLQLEYSHSCRSD